MSVKAASRERHARKAYNSGSTMARTLETLEPGTPVYAGATRVGTVTGVYAEGEARSAELIAVHWDARGEDVAVQCIFDGRETVDLRKRLVERLRLRIDRAQRQPGEQHYEHRNDRYDRCQFHGAASTTAAPR